LAHYAVLPKDFVMTTIVIPNHLDIVEVEHASVRNNEGLRTSNEYRNYLKMLGLDAGALIETPSVPT